MRAYTMLDLRLGLVKFTPEQQKVIDEKVVPIFVRVVRREVRRLMAEQAQHQHRKAAVGDQ